MATITIRNASATEIAQIKAIIDGTAKAPATKAPAKTAKKGKATTKPGTAIKRMSREDFKALKIKGLVPWRMTQKDAHALGLLDADNTPLGTPDTVKTTTRKGKKTAKGKVNKKAAKAAKVRGTAITTPAKMSGLWTKADDGKGWVSLYARMVNEDWGYVSNLREDHEPAEVIELYVTHLRDEGVKVKHYTKSNGARQAREAKQAARA